MGNPVWGSGFNTGRRAGYEEGYNNGYGAGANDNNCGALVCGMIGAGVGTIIAGGISMIIDAFAGSGKDRWICGSCGCKFELPHGENPSRCPRCGAR